MDFFFWEVIFWGVDFLTVRKRRRRAREVRIVFVIATFLHF